MSVDASEHADLHRPAWLPDEVASAGRENLDVDHVARYDATEDAGAAAEVALLRRLGLDASSVVVELGTGTGQFALAAAPMCARVVAVDVSPVMLDVLTAEVAAAGASNVEVVRAGFLTYRHRGDPSDAVYPRYALHHLPDAWKPIALTRMRSVLRPGGLLRWWDVVHHFPAEEAAERLEARCATGGDPVEGEWSRAESEEHVRDEHSTSTWLLEPMFAQAGFAVETAEHSEDGIVAKHLLRAT